MKSFSHEFAVILLTVLSAVLLCACSGSGRSGYGPYDVTDYSALDAQQELREGQMEMTMYPIDDYYDMLAEEQATMMAADALTEYLSEQYFLEQVSGE